MDLREATGKMVARHPWEQARATFFARLIRDRLAHDSPLRVLDVGAGDGYAARTILELLPRGSEVVCFDPAYKPEHLAVPPIPGISRTSVHPGGSFGLLLLLDVLEHVSDERTLLRELVEKTLPVGGAALVSVPAFMALYTRHDVVLGHRRRYGAEDLREVMKSAGLRVDLQGGLFHSLLAPRALQKLLELARGTRSKPLPYLPSGHAETETGRWRSSPAVTRVVDSILAADNWLSDMAARLHVALPGLSTWALATKIPP